MLQRGDTAWVQVKSTPYICPVEVKIAKARKARKCDICGKMFQVGELHGDNKYGGSGKYCVSCCKSDKPKIEIMTDYQ